MKKIKICYAISSLANQGPPNVLYNMIRYMDFERFDVSIITMVDEPAGSRIDEFRALPIKVVQMSPQGAQNPLAMYLALRRAVRAEAPDIVHVHCPRSRFLVPLLPKRFKTVETVHIYPGVQQRVLYGKVKGQVVIWLSNFFTKRMDLPLACSESVAESYLREQGFRMQAIPNGCSLPLWKPDMEQKTNLRQQFGMSPSKLWFIFVGRFSQEKHPELIVQAFKRLAGEGIGVVLLGEGRLYDELKKEESDNIIMPGFKTNVYDYLVASDYYISASDTEGLANTLLESMTVGLPCVLSNIGAHREVVDKAAKPMGFTFDNKSMPAMVKAIRDVLALDREQTRLSIQKLFEEHYTAKAMSEKYQEAYSDLMS